VGRRQRKSHRCPCCRTSIHTNTRTSNSNPPSIPIQLQTKQANNVSHLPARPKPHHPTPNLPSGRRLKALRKLDWSNSSTMDVRAPEAMAVTKEHNARKHKPRSEYKVDFCRPASIYLAEVLTGPSLLQLRTKRKSTRALLSEST
jgi:hypothetical protein